LAESQTDNQITLHSATKFTVDIIPFSGKLLRFLALSACATAR